jgi:hypothetical protein
MDSRNTRLSKEPKCFFITVFTEACQVRVSFLQQWYQNGDPQPTKKLQDHPLCLARHYIQQTSSSKYR